MKFSGMMGLAAASCLLPAVAAQANLVIDGNFDLATSGTQTSGSPWTLVVNSPDGTNDAAQFQTGFANAQNTGAGGPQVPGVGNGVWFRSFEGNQGGSGEPGASATLTQSVLAAVDGDYALSFVAGREVNFVADAFFVSLLSSGTGGTATVNLLTASIPDGNIGGAASGNAGGTLFNALLTGVTAGDTLTIVATMANGLDSQVPGGQTGFLDSFELVLVPEPTSMILFSAAGLLLVRGRRGQRR